jgi:formate hydrogenlyase subunit 6/NADH:ubiquinone oxidoreductase subunit I
MLAKHAVQLIKLTLQFPNKPAPSKKRFPHAEGFMLFVCVCCCVCTIYGMLM